MCILSHIISYLTSYTLISDVVFDVDVPLHLLLNQGMSFPPGFFMFSNPQLQSCQKRPYHFRPSWVIEFK